MGKTNPTFRTVLDRFENEEWNQYRRMLRRRDQPLYDELWKKARNHADATNAANPRPMDGALFSMLIDQQREINELQEELKQVREEVGVNAGRIETLSHEPPVEELEARYEAAEIAEAERRGDRE